MILLDTTVLVYAVGTEHPLRDPSRRVIEAIGDGLPATTTPEVIQEFAHVAARRRSREQAASWAAAYVDLLSPLAVVGEQELASGLRLFESVEQLGAFDAVLAATALEHEVDALVSADVAFDAVPKLRFVALDSTGLEALLA